MREIAFYAKEPHPSQSAAVRREREVLVQVVIGRDLQPFVVVRISEEVEHLMWVFSDPHFGHAASVGIFGRPFRSCHHGDSYLLEQWTHDVRDQDTVIVWTTSPWPPRRTV